MKKILGYLVVVVILLLTLSACSRNLSTPSTRLVGHWKTTVHPIEEVFISKVDTETGEGTFTVYVPSDGSVIVSHYEIFTEVPRGNEITLITKSPIGTENIIDVVVREDGLRATMYPRKTMESIRLLYIDSETKY
jgi:hypothetical protein